MITLRFARHVLDLALVLDGRDRFAGADFLVECGYLRRLERFDLFLLRGRGQ